MAFRIDSGTLGKVQRTPQGGVIVPANVARTGVQTYRNADGTTRREYRPPEEVFAPLSLATLADAPVTIDHPNALVTPENYASVAKGHARGDARAEPSGFVACTLVVQDAETIARIDTRELVECSMGYEMDFDPTPGEVEGVRYDGVQRNIRYNHVALGPVGWARAGREAALRLDSDSAVLDDVAPQSATRATMKGVTMKIRIPKLEILHADRKIRIDGVTLPLKTSAERLTAQEAMHRALNAMRESATRADAVEAATLQALMDAMSSVYEQFMSFADAVMGATTTQEVIPTPADQAAADAAAGAPPAQDPNAPKGDSNDFEYRLEVIDHARQLAPTLQIDTKAKPRVVMDSVLKHLAIEVPKRVTTDEGVSALFFSTKPSDVNAAANARRAVEGRNDSARDDGDPVAKAKNKANEAISNAWKKRTA